LYDQRSRRRSRASRFGKHKGQSELPPDYLVWIAEKSELDEDLKWNTKHELE
jgi:hypothetical protein